MVLAAITVGLLMMVGLQPALGQNGTNPLTIFQNFFVTGDYVVAGWVEGAPDGSGFTTGTISVPDGLQPAQPGVPASVPKGADIVAAYLYWATVESNQTSMAGKNAFFNGYPITGALPGNPNAPPTSWSAGGCSGSPNGSKTMRTYRADVHPYLPLDTDPASSTYGATIANGKFTVRLADSGSNGNTVPIALGATLVIIYRVLAPAALLNAIVLYDGAFSPSNGGQNISQTMMGFYQPGTTPLPPPAPQVLQAKITHIVANGQANKNEQVNIFDSSKKKFQPLASLYGNGSLPPFPGIYGTWDNPTWVVSNYVNTADTSETTSVVPSNTNSGCVSWGAMILSTTVQDTDGDGLLDKWESDQGYTDAVPDAMGNHQWVALPGADPNFKDIFVELDYFSNLDGSAGPILHSHLPKRDALDAVGALFLNQNIKVHFDLGPGIYPVDPYVISYPVQINLPPGTSPPQMGAGGNSISEGGPLLLCKDGAQLCAFPGPPAVGWKGGLSFVQNSPTLGNFQSGRGQSYHYILFGHSLGEPRSYWSTVGTQLAVLNPNSTMPRLVSIKVTGNQATITLLSPSFFNNPPKVFDNPPTTLKPGDCTKYPALQACGDASNSRITITGALGQTSLNGSYPFSNATTTPSAVQNVVMTTFSIPNVAKVPIPDGTYNYANEPQLAVTYLGPTSSSGHSDFRGGGDTVVTLGLWGADDPPNCQIDPRQSLTANQVYCSNGTGTVAEQTGTLLHELGHTLTLTHGGTMYPDPTKDPNPSVPTNGLNCAPNYLSVMNYLFQVRGFVDGGFEYSTQTLPLLDESALDESKGIGTDIVTGNLPPHLTRWYAQPNQLDSQLNQTSGGRLPTHCDGTPALPTDPPVVRVDGAVFPGGTFSAPLDWNNDGSIEKSQIFQEDLNHDGIPHDAIRGEKFSGFNDWPAMNLQQIGARKGALGFSGGGVENSGAGVENSGAGVENSGAGVDNSGAGVENSGAGVENSGAGVENSGAGTDQTEDTATSTADRPTALTCTVPLNSVPGCVASSGGFVESGKSVPLTWTAPGFGQTRSYIIWRAVGSFGTLAQIISNTTAFSVIKTLTGAPPSPSFVDTNVKNNTIYTYFVVDKNKQGAQSGPSDPLVVTVGNKP
jgi:hypothetical protein